MRDALLAVDGLHNHEIVSLDHSSADYKIAAKLKPGQKLSNVREGPRAVHTWEIPEVFGRTNKYERTVLHQVIRLRRQNRIRDFGDADPVSTQLLNDLFGSKTLENLVKKGYLKKIGECHDLVGTFNGKYRRLHFDEPSYTVDTRFGNPRSFLHPTENRGFSVREAARIQGFPDEFIFSGTSAQQFRMIGNAVPPPMAENIALYLKEAFNL